MTNEEMANKEMMMKYLQLLTEERQGLIQLRTSARNRIVWFVAIIGFVIFYGIPSFHTISGGEFNRIMLFVILLPSIFFLLFAILTHIIIDETWVKENLFYVIKRSYIDKYLSTKYKTLKQDYEEYKKILHEGHHDLKKSYLILGKWGKRTRCFERTTFYSLFFSLLWMFFISLLFCII